MTASGTYNLSNLYNLAGSDQVRVVLVAVAFALWAATPAAAQQPVRGVVLDQTGLPIPGATVAVFDGVLHVASVSTGPDGTFNIDAGVPGDTLVVSLEGFETERVDRREAQRVVLQIGRVSGSTTVSARSAAPASPTEELLGRMLTAATIARLPSSRMRARESLPLLPSVTRGPDGLLQLGGARATDTPLLLDGFNVTDPATGISSINLPFEAVSSVDVLRDPMGVNYGGMLAGLIRMESRPGGERLKFGVQGVVPRPRFTSPGFGRLEGIFPRGHADDTIANGRVRYFAAVEYDYERIPVPEVTRGRGPDIVEESSTVFVRLDAPLSHRHALTLETVVFPYGMRSRGLTPRRAEEATADLSSRDVFAGATHRFVANERTVFTLQLGVLEHESSLTPKGQGTSFLNPEGWRGNWFVAARRDSVRYSAAATWERLAKVRGRSHHVTIGGEAALRTLHGTVSASPIVVANSNGDTVRTVDFGSPARVGARDRPLGLAVRDVWQASDRLQLDGGVRVDHSRHGGGAPSARLGARYLLDSAGVTVIKAGYGSFVGGLPLAVPAFGDYPGRTDRSFDPSTGQLVTQAVMRPSVGRLRFPRALAVVFGVERRLRPGLDAQVTLTSRVSRRLATLQVPSASGALSVESSGSGRYREVQASARQSLPDDQQIFVSYVRSSSGGELNDFATLFQTFDAPLVQRGGTARLSGDAPHRVLMWGTFNLPRRVVVSPVVEWRSGFPYSVVDDRYRYAGAPHGAAYPAFFSTDLVVYKTVTVRGRSADLGIQLFNATNHHNPRDVYPVAGSARCGQFTNSVGPILRGYMLLKW